LTLDGAVTFFVAFAAFFATFGACFADFGAGFASFGAAFLLFEVDFDAATFLAGTFLAAAFLVGALAAVARFAFGLDEALALTGRLAAFAAVRLAAVRDVDRRNPFVRLLLIWF
jgi:hypothetical protein